MEQEPIAGDDLAPPVLFDSIPVDPVAEVPVPVPVTEGSSSN